MPFAPCDFDICGIVSLLLDVVCFRFGSMSAIKCMLRVDFNVPLDKETGEITNTQVRLCSE